MATSTFKLLKNICLLGLIGLGILSIVASGGDNDQSVGEGDGTVVVNNYDDKEYRVQLRRLSDNSIVANATVFAFDAGDSDWTLRFKDVPNGDYYLVILRNDTEQDRSGSFSITGEQERCYEIDDDGDLQGG